MTQPSEAEAERTCNEYVQPSVGPGYYRCGQSAAWIVRATSGLHEPRCWRHGVAYSEDRRTPIPLPKVER